MQEEQQQATNILPKKSKISVQKIVIYSLMIAFIFSIGVLVGNGKLTINNGERFEAVAEVETDDLSTDGLQEIYDKLVQNYDGQINPSDLLDGLKKGAVAAVGDTYTEYLNQTETVEFNSDLNGTFEGIGAELSKENGFVIVVAPIKGTPADKAGIRPGDIIIEIDGESSTDITVYEAVKLIRGEKGTEVVLTVVREGESLEVPIIRGTIDIPSVEWRVEDGIGIIELSRFGDDTTILAQKAAREFRDAGIDKVILDMRGNPGGLLDEAVGVSSIWLPKGSVVLSEKRDGETIKSFKTSRSPILEGVKTVALINIGSASASEIVAGALKDNGAATLVGETSYGKGSVQQIIKLSGGGSLKVTIARWFTPSDKNIDKEGIEPDVEVELTSENIENKEDPQLDEAKKLL